MYNVSPEGEPVNSFITGIIATPLLSKEVLSSNASLLLEIGDEITVEAVSNSGFVGNFITWVSGPCQGSSNPTCTFTMTEDIELVAEFEAGFVTN